MSEFKPSKFQEAVFKFVQYSSGSAIVEAVAGSGKTTTIVHAAHLVPDYKRCIFLAFNKSIATELASKLPRHVQAKTFHALGMSAWRQSLGDAARSLKVDGNKTRAVFQDRVSEDAVEFRLYNAFVRKLVSYAKQEGFLTHLQPHPQYLEWRALVDHFDLNCPDDPTRSPEEAMVHGIQLASRTLHAGNELSDRIIDFDDMLYMPLLAQVRFYRNDLVFVDEAQDTNGIQIEILKRVVKPNGRVIAVGDPAQAIYGFRGAQSDALENIAKAFKCETLPLSICYRCAQSVVREAQTKVSHIQAHEHAPEGSVTHMGTKWSVMDFRSGDAIVCRNAKPLIATALKMYASRVPATVVGRDLGESLKTMVRATGAKTLDVLEEKLGNKVSALIRKIEIGKADECELEALEDKVACIEVMSEHLGPDHRSTADLLELMDSIFEGQGGVKLCTIHKAKGLEWDNVYFLDSHLLPSKYAKQPWQLEQEDNLYYVAVTRAAKTLTYIDSSKG